MTAVKTRLVKIGNSRGIRIPKLLLEQAGLADRVEIVLDDSQLIVRPLNAPRQGWEEAFSRMAAAGDDRLLDPETLTTWDETEWEWEAEAE
jgi:antitoxin MazE